VEVRELDFIVHSLVELKLQVEELRRQVADERAAREHLMRAVGVGGTPINVMPGTMASVSGMGAGNTSPALVPGEVSSGASIGRFGGGGIEPKDQPTPPITVTIRPDMGMAAIERAAIEAALRETRGNRRKAAELLGIGERTLYRKLRDYQLLVDTSALD
jgi:DNA-binding NtrC family response regulator